ncbi:MAG: hypothetical protein FJ293_06450, partial [Planctomycetes bacterium]|nr:hypothetical protein [Planctomycetota bacterium]
MTACLLVAALWLVALAMQPLAFDLLALKRSALLLATLPLLFTRELGAALTRPLCGPLRLVGIAVALALPLTVLGREFGQEQAAALPAACVALQALLELLLFAAIGLLAREVAWERAGTVLRGVMLLGGSLALLALLQAAGLAPCDGLGTTGVAVATFGNSNAFAAFAAPCLAIAVAFAARAAGGVG